MGAGRPEKEPALPRAPPGSPKAFLLGYSAFLGPLPLGCSPALSLGWIFPPHPLRLLICTCAWLSAGQESKQALGKLWPTVQRGRGLPKDLFPQRQGPGPRLLGPQLWAAPESR